MVFEADTVLMETEHKKRRSPDPARIREVYIDESSQTKHRFLLLGAVTIPLLEQAEATRALLDSRLPELPSGEMKWVKVSTAKIEAYKRFIDTFFDHKSCTNAHFHSVVIDTHKLNDKQYNDGSREIGFNKEIYQLANKCAEIYPGLFHLYPDHRETTNTPDQLRLILNRGRRKKGDKRSWPFRRCQFRDSGKVAILQLADLLLGAIAFNLNGHHHKDGASRAKIDLMRHVLHRAGIQDPDSDTSRTGKFTIWHRKLR